MLCRKMEQLGWSRHDLQDLKSVIDSFPGCQDILRENGGFWYIQASIDDGNPVILRGNFTHFGQINGVSGADHLGALGRGSPEQPSTPTRPSRRRPAGPISRHGWTPCQP